MINKDLENAIIELAETYDVDMICINNAHVTCIKLAGDEVEGLDEALEKLANDYTVDVTCVNNTDIMGVSRLWRRVTKESKETDDFDRMLEGLWNEVAE